MHRYTSARPLLPAPRLPRSLLHAVVYRSTTTNQRAASKSRLRYLFILILKDTQLSGVYTSGRFYPNTSLHVHMCAGIPLLHSMQEAYCTVCTTVPYRPSIQTWAATAHDSTPNAAPTCGTRERGATSVQRVHTTHLHV
jgi:hypothetical protein